MIQDETDFDKLYADAACADDLDRRSEDAAGRHGGHLGVKGRGSAERKLADKYTDKNGVPHPEKLI